MWNNNPTKKLTIKQRRFVDEVIATWNATESASKVYKVKNRTTAWAIGTENLQKPLIKAEIEDRLQIAKDNIFKLANKAKSENVRLSANQDIIDRREGKATQKIVSDTNLNINIEEASMGDLLSLIKK